MTKHRWRHVLSGLGRAAMLALAGFMLMGSLAVIGASSGRDPVVADVAELVTSEAVTELPADRPEPGQAADGAMR